MGKGESSLATLARITKIVILVYIVGSLAFAAANGFTLYYATTAMANTISPESTQTLVILGIVSSVLSLAATGALLLTFVLVPLWVHRAWSNLHEARLEGLNYSPGWATASFFVPFVNTVVPMKALRELHNRSHGESDWHAAISVGDVTSWYACTWAAFLVTCVTAGYFAIDSIPGVILLLPTVAIFGLIAMVTIFTLGSAYFLMRVIGGVTAAQSEMLHYAQAGVFE